MYIDVIQNQTDYDISHVMRTYIRNLSSVRKRTRLVILTT